MSPTLTGLIITFIIHFVMFLFVVLGHAHLTDFNIATIIKDGERATALAGTKPYMGIHFSCFFVSFSNRRDLIFVSLQQ